MSRFLKDYQTFSEKASDASLEFTQACGLSLLSSVLVRYRWLNIGKGVHPNLYTLLVGNSSDDRKSTSINRAMDMLALVSPRRAANLDFSAASLVHMMGDHKGKQGRRVMTLSFEEFGDSLAKMNLNWGGDIGTTLTKLYDGKSFEVSRLTQGKPYKVKNPSLAILAAGAYGMLEKHVKPLEWDGGFFARILFILPHTKRPPFTVEPAFPQVEHDNALMSLKHIHGEVTNNKSVMSVSRSAEQLYIKYANAVKADDFQSLTAFDAVRARLLNIMWKVAMVYQVDLGPGLTITDQAVDLAWKFGNTAMNNFKYLYNRCTGDDHTKNMRKVEAAVIAAGATGLTKREIHRKTHLLDGMVMPSIDALLRIGFICEKPGNILRYVASGTQSPI